MSRKQQLIHQLKRELELRNYAQSSISVYGSCLAVFLTAMAGKPAPLDIEHVKTFLLTITNQNYHKQMVATIHHFYRLVLKQPLSLKDIPYPRATHYLPQIFNVVEYAALVGSISNLKHRAIIQVMYACALRIGEVVAIKIEHVDGVRGLLMVKGAKGFKDRYVPIPCETLELLRNYFKVYYPKVWLFEGQYSGQYSVRSIQQVFYRQCRAIGMRKRVTPHSLRHSRLTHLKEAGVDIYELKEIAGHNNIKTTEIYLHLAKSALSARIAQADSILSQVMVGSGAYTKQVSSKVL